MVFQAQTKKRKISDVFSPIPKKVALTKSSNVGAKDISESAIETTSPLLKKTSLTDATTQTDGFQIEINSFEEGKKFLAKRIFNFEAFRIHQDYEICSIADFRFNSDDSISSQAINYLSKIQAKDDKVYKWREQDIYTRRHRENCEKNVPRNRFAQMSDQMIQYGEDNPDEDFLEGMKLMADDIELAEKSRLGTNYWCDSEEARRKRKPWKSTCPHDLINEVADKMTEIRVTKGKYDSGDKWRF